MTPQKCVIAGQVQGRGSGSELGGLAASKCAAVVNSVGTMGISESPAVCCDIVLLQWGSYSP